MATLFVQKFFNVGQSPDFHIAEVCYAAIIVRSDKNTRTQSYRFSMIDDEFWSDALQRFLVREKNSMLFPNGRRGTFDANSPLARVAHE